MVFNPEFGTRAFYAERAATRSRHSLAPPSYRPDLLDAPIRPLTPSTSDPVNERYFRLLTQSLVLSAQGPELAQVRFFASQVWSHQPVGDFVRQLEDVLRQPRRRHWTTGQKLVLFSVLVHGKAKGWLVNLARLNEVELYSRHNSIRSDHRLDPLAPPAHMPLVALLMYTPVLSILQNFRVFLSAFKAHFSKRFDTYTPELDLQEMTVVPLKAQPKERFPPFPKPPARIPTTTTSDACQVGSYDLMCWTEEIERIYCAYREQFGRRRRVPHFDDDEQRRERDRPLTPQEEYKYIT